jgi:thermostable 8-oxoguanine DNA glycosylase
MKFLITKIKNFFLLKKLDFATKIHRKAEKIFHKFVKTRNEDLKEKIYEMGYKIEDKRSKFIFKTDFYRFTISKRKN